MNVYSTDRLSSLLSANAYPGRGIVIGTTPDRENAVCAYFIMGRSENSRNRVFVSENGTVRTEPFDSSKVADPSLIIYNAVRTTKNGLIVTNGDQTDTVYRLMNEGKSFKEALETREFEPDAPNFTPRISGFLSFDGGFRYEMSILKSADEKGSACCRYTYSYPSVPGLGHFLHTYVSDGNPLPSFTGEPHRAVIENRMEDFAKELWESLHAENKISLYVRYTNIKTGKFTDTLINKNKGERR